ncbi:MAG TPA: carboxylating nicotinate-nucleotide diphosphorylase [Cytophagaceae bacterium]|jgi:nicotinate-nucleotide pyrophosphorylase (carboxylating)|nr:carboxylating nicotinate-nucleotide diphosphorylase [Cytophagaceae bacterium]
MFVAVYDYLHSSHIHSFIQQALQEDVGSGDHSSLASIPIGTTNRAQLLVKDNGTLAGVELSRYIFETVDPTLSIEYRIKDGEHISKGDIVLTVKGSAHSILKAERLVLNCMQRMSGIATYTRRLNTLIEGTGCKLLDTRKTTPNFRLPEKWAVKIGGGINHRYGLFDMILLKDNHVDYAGGITNALKAAKTYVKKTGLHLDIELETRSLEEVKEALLEGGVKRIMLDNMPLEMMKEAVKLIGKTTETEASGGITETTIRDVALCGVDYISVGALTHSVKSLDLSLKAY